MKSPRNEAGKRLNEYKLCAILFSLISAILGAISFAAADDRYPSTSFFILTILAAGYAFSSFFFLHGFKPATEAAPSTTVCSKLPALAMVGVAVWEISKLISGAKSIFGVATVVLALVSALFYGTVRHSRLERVSSPSAYGCLLLCVILAMRMYTDMTLEINAPLKLLTQFSAILLILSIIADLRTRSGVCPISQYVCAKFLFISVSIPCGVCGLTALIVGNNLYPLDYTLYPILFLTCGIDALASLLSCSVKADPVTTE